MSEQAPGGARRTTIDDVLAAARARIRRYAPAEALAAHQAGALLVDTRSADDLRLHGAVPGALHFPLSVLPWRADPDCAWRDDRVARPDAEVVLLCKDGWSSSLAAALLGAIGFARVGDVDGGFVAWAEAGLPVTPAGEAPAAATADSPILSP